MSDDNTSPQVWRVECDDGMREVTLLRNGHGSLVVRARMHVEMVYCPTAPARYAVSRYAGACEWPVVSVLAPGEMTRAELAAEVARLTTERDAAVAAEREACAALCAGEALEFAMKTMEHCEAETRGEQGPGPRWRATGARLVCEQMAEMIRGRGKETKT